MKSIVIGTTFVDIKGFPEGDFCMEGRNAGEIQYVHGGVGRNIVENIARCGYRPVFISAMDESPLSEDILKRLSGEGINLDYIVRTKDGLGTWMAIFDEEGDVVASISKRSDLSRIVEILNRYESEIFQDADNVLVEIDMEPEIIDCIMGYAKKYGLPVFAVISNMAKALAYQAFSQDISCFVCNEQEAGMMFDQPGADLTTGEMCKLLKARLSAYPIEKMVITMGGEGAVYYDKEDGSAGIVAAAPAEVCDTTGAGDAFFSGVSMGLGQGNTLEEACKKGAYLAACVIGTKENVCPENTTL
jgi:pseudouridine kinase